MIPPLSIPVATSREVRAGLGHPTGWMAPREFAFTARPTGGPFSEGVLSLAPRPLTPIRGILLPPLGSPVTRSPSDLEAGSARLPDRLHLSEGFCLHRLAHRSPLLRGISSPAPQGSPTAYIFPRDFASIAWLTGHHFSEGFSSPTAQPVEAVQLAVCPKAA